MSLYPDGCRVSPVVLGFPYEAADAEALYASRVIARLIATDLRKLIARAEDARGLVSDSDARRQPDVDDAHSAWGLALDALEDAMAELPTVMEWKP